MIRTLNANIIALSSFIRYEPRSTFPKIPAIVTLHKAALLLSTMCSGPAWGDDAKDVKQLFAERRDKRPRRIAIVRRSSTGRKSEQIVGGSVGGAESEGFDPSTKGLGRRSESSDVHHPHKETKPSFPWEYLQWPL